MKQARSKGIKRLINAFRYSCDGLAATTKTEEAFRQELILAALLIPLSFFLDVTPAEQALLILSIFIVLIVELLNTGIEVLVERISPEIHELSKYAKDVGSAAVLLALAAAAAVWGIILIG